MKNVSFAILATVAAALALPTIANAASLTENDESVFGRDKFNVERTLASRGIDATDLAAWGQTIQATVTAADGTKTIQYFDKDTLQPVRANGGSLTSGVSSTESYGRGEFGAGNNTIISQ